MSHSIAEKVPARPRPLNLSRTPAKADEVEYLHQWYAEQAPARSSFSPTLSAISRPQLADRVRRASSKSDTWFTRTSACFPKKYTLGRRAKTPSCAAHISWISLLSTYQNSALTTASLYQSHGKDFLRQPPSAMHEPVLLLKSHTLPVETALFCD